MITFEGLDFHYEPYLLLQVIACSVQITVSYNLQYYPAQIVYWVVHKEASKLTRAKETPEKKGNKNCLPYAFCIGDFILIVKLAIKKQNKAINQMLNVLHQERNLWWSSTFAAINLKSPEIVDMIHILCSHFLFMYKK